MRITRHILLLFAWMGALASCTVMEVVEEPQGQPVTLTIETEGTRGVEGTHNGDDIDSRIDQIRVLGYKTSNYTLAFNELVSIDVAGSNLANGIANGTVDVLTGNYHFVFIANEDSDPVLPDALKNQSGEISTLPKLRELSFDQTAFDPNKSIPMVTWVENIKVLGDDSYQIAGGSIESGAWLVDMERLAIRVELELEMSESFAASGPTLSFANVPDKVYLFQKENAENTAVRTITTAPTEATATDGKRLTWSRIILPESWFTPITSTTKGIEVRLSDGSQVKSALLGMETENTSALNYTMPRNHYFYVVGTVDESSDPIDFNAQVMSWNQALLNLGIGNPVYYLELLNVDMKIDNTDGATVVLGVRTNYPGDWRAEVSDSKSGVEFPYAGWWDEDYEMNWPLFSTNAGRQWPFTSRGDKDVSIKYNSTNMDAHRPVYIHITAGRLTVVAQISPPPLIQD